jgi:type II secretory pathway pseudopilin PulG
MIVIAIIAIIAAIAIPNLLAAKLTSNETAAIATLRSVVTAQAQISVAGRIDADNDGRGEFGTFMEMTGSVGVRRGFSPGPPAASNFSVIGPTLNPPVLSTVMASIDANGFITKAGYAYMVFLPDTGDPALFVHETGPVSSPGLTGDVGVDLSEVYWCAYAQPVALHNSGNRRFFSSMRGDILQSSNDVAKMGGVSSPILPESAFMGTGITSTLAAGTKGMDGDVWKSAN